MLANSSGKHAKQSSQIEAAEQRKKKDDQSVQGLLIADVQLYAHLHDVVCENTCEQCSARMSYYCVHDIF